MPTGRLADPQWRKKRASKAAHASHTLDSYIRRIVDRAPELSAAQRDALAGLLRPTGRTPDSGEAA